MGGAAYADTLKTEKDPKAVFVEAMASATSLTVGKVEEFFAALEGAGYLVVPKPADTEVAGGVVDNTEEGKV